LDPEAVAVDLWRIRWEAMLGQAAKARALSANYKKWCGKYFEKNDKLCREFASTWLSRLWFEGHDNDERWVRKLKPIVETWTWWQLQRAVVRRNWAVAEALADRWMRLGGETSQERRSYWLHLVRARRNASSSKDVWREFADRYSSGEQDFYKLTAKHFAGYSLAADSSVASPPAQDDGDDEADDEETEQELAHKTDATCLPTLAPQWPKIKDARAEFLINDDLKWFSERWQLAPRRQCVGQIRAMERELLEHCQAGMLSQLPIVPYQDEFRTVSERFDVPRGLLAGLSKQESGFCAKAVSWADAIGLMQLQWSKRVRALGLLTHPEQLYDPKLNIEAGALELKRLRDRFQGNWFMTLAAYNAGEDVVRLWNKRRPHSSNFQFIETMPFQETRDYVRNVFANWMRYELKDPKSTSDSAFNHLARL
jgi:soluble lytic murein transglycosylase